MQKRKLTSWFLTICLLVTQILTPDAAQAASLAFAPAQNETQSMAAWEPSTLTGKVTRRVLADRPKGTLIHIQDAHAVFEAQKNIQALLGEVKRVSSAENIFIEGGAGELDPQLKHFFPNGLTLSPETREAWMKEGHLTGAEAYLMESERVRGFGIEEIQSYWNNVELYRRVDARRSDTEAFLHAWYEIWQKEAGKQVKPAFKKYLEAYVRAQSDAAVSASWFDALRDYLKSEWDRDLSSTEEQIDFPMLARYTYLKKIDNAPDYSKVEKQKKEFFAAIKASGGTENILHEMDALIEKFKSNQIDLSGAREVFERFAAHLPADFSMSRWPDLKTLIEKIILAGEMDPDALLSEARRLHVQIIKKDAPLKAQRELVLLLEKQILLRKLFSLELTRDDFQKILNHPARPQMLVQQLSGEEHIFENGQKGLAALNQVYDDAIRFYHGAVARESGMRQVIQKTAQKDRVFVAVTGGFHAEGMESFAREQNWNYLALMPRISKIQPEDFAHYRRALLGKGSARSEMGEPSEVAAALITSPQVMRDPHAAERSEAVLNLPGAAEALRKMESHAAPRDGKNSSRMKRSATRQSDKPMTDWEGLSRPVGRSETRLQEAIEKIRDWQLSHKDVLLQPSEADPFESLLEKEARRIYQQKKLDELSVADRTKFVQAVFGDIDAAIVQFTEGWIDKLTEEERQSALPLNYMTFSKVSRDMASLEHRYSMLQNQMIRTAGDLVFNLDSAEKRVLELEWILSQIDLELKRPGTGEIPIVLAMQDLHGGTRRALGLLAHAYGLPPDSFRRIKNLNDLIQLLDEKNMSLENLSGRIIGLNDLVDRGKDPVGSTELVARLQKTEKGRFILGNHDLWRMMGALGIHHLFNREKEEDFLKEEKGHHAAWWSWEAFHHAGWGDIELDQRNQARFNYIVEEMNAYLRDKKEDGQHFAAIDLGEVRAQMDEQLKKAKSKNKKLRTDWQIQSNDEKELAEKEKRPPIEIPIPEYEPLPDVFQATLAFLNEKTAAYTERVMELRQKYPGFPGFEDFTALDLNNYDRDPEIVASVLFQLQNFRLFYIDMLGNLHMHNIIPFDQNGFKVNYKGQHGLAALELMTKDIRTFFENVRVHDVIGTNASEQSAFREKMWNELGAAFEVMNEWYSDTIPVAKAQFVKKFVHEGDLSTLMGRTSGTFVDREVSGFVIWGHNELGKFADQDMSPWTFFEEFGSGILNIDGEMSEGYSDRGFLLTMGRRDANGRMSGLKLWSYPKKELGIDDSVIEEATYHLPDPIFKIRKEFEAVKTALEKQVAELKAGQNLPSEIEAKEAELRTLQENYESSERRYQKQKEIISKLSDGETYLKWLQFKLLKELENLLAEAAESSSLAAAKKKNFAHRRQVAANLFKSAENPLVEKITGGSATLFVQSPTVKVRFGPDGENLHLEVHPAVSKKLEEAEIGFAPSVNEGELEKMYPSSEEYAANQAAYEMVNQNFEQIDRFRVSHNAALADLSSSEEWSEDKVKHFFENMEVMLAANRNYTGLPENRENDKLEAQELEAKFQQLRADYLTAAAHSAGAVSQFFRQMQGIWGSVIGQQVSGIDTFNKLINFTHNRFSDRLMGGSEASRQARFMDLDHYLTRNDIAPQRARVSRFFSDRLLRGLIGGPYDKTYQLIMRGSFFWLQKTLGVHKMQVYLDLSPPEFGGTGEIILYESGDDQGNILRRKLVAQVLNQLGFETSEQDTQTGIARKQLRLRAILKKNQSVKTISDLFFRMQLALYFLNTIKEGDIYLEELSLFYSPDAMEKIVNALVMRVLKTGGQFRIANNPRYLLGYVRQGKSEGGQTKEEVVPLLGQALDRRTADTPLGILTNTGGMDDHERILSAIKTGEGQWWNGTGPYEDIYQADFKKDGRRIYDAAVATLRALGLALPPDYDPTKFGQLWLHEHVNQVIQRALTSGKIRKNNGQFEKTANGGESVLAAPEWFLNEWGAAGSTNQTENQKQMILTARQMEAVPFEPSLVGRIGSAFLYQGQIEFLDHLVDIVIARDRYGKNIAAVLYENGDRLSTEDIDQILGSAINMKEMNSAVQADEHRAAVEALEAPLTAAVFLGEPLRGLSFLSGLKSGKAFFSAEAARENRGILFLERAEHTDIRALESAQGLVTSTGNLLDHINTEARSYSKPRVGIHGGKIDAVAKKATLSKAIQEEVRVTGSGIVYSVFKDADKTNVIQEGDWVTLDGSTGMIYLLPKEPRVVAGLEKLMRLQASSDLNEGGAADLSAWLEQAERDENWDGVKLVLNELTMNASSYAHDLWAEIILKVISVTDSHNEMTSHWATLKNYIWVDTWQAYERHLSGMASAVRQDQLYYELSGARTRLIAAEEFFKFLGSEDQMAFALKLKESKKKLRVVYSERMRSMRSKVLRALRAWDESGRPAFDGQDQNPPRFLLRRWIGQIEEFERSGFLFRGLWMGLVAVAKRLFDENQNAKAHRIKQAKEKLILPLEEVEVGMFRFTGYKAQNLGWLTRFLNWHNKQAKADFKIAEGAVITQAAFEEFLKQPHPSLQKPLGQLISEMLSNEDFSEKNKAFKILEWIQSMPLPARLKSEIEQVVGKTDLWATRSSTTLEDTPTSAAAGLFQSTLSLKGIEQIEKGIKTAWASFYSEKALIYRRGIKAEDLGQGVILQKMVDADYSGVITSAGMATEDRGLVVINAGLGLGSSIVDAVQDADVFTYDRITGFIQAEAGDKAKIVLPGEGGVRQVESMRSARQDEEGRAKLSLTNEQVRRMAALAMALEEAFGYVIQAEFAIKDGQIYVMQVRPMSGFKILRDERNKIDQWLRSEARSTGSGQARSEMRLPEKPEWLSKKEEANWRAIHGENGFLDSLSRKVQQSRNVQQLLNDAEILIVMPVAYEISPDRTSNLIDDLQDYARHQTAKKVKIIAVAEHDSSTAQKLENRKDESFQILYKDEKDKGKGISELAGLYLSTKALNGRGAEVVVVLDADLKFSNGEESAKSLLNSLIKEFQKNEKTAMVLLHALKRRFSDDDGLAHFWTLAFTEALYGLSFNQSHGGEFAVSRDAVSKFFEAQREKTQPTLSVEGVYDFEHLLMLRLAGLIHDSKLDGFLVQHTKVYKDHTETTPEKIFKRMGEELIPRLFETAISDRAYIEAQPDLGKRAYYDELGLAARYKDKEVKTTTFMSIAGTFLRSHFHDLEPLKNLNQHPELTPFLAGLDKGDQRLMESGAQVYDFREFEFNPAFFGVVTRNAMELFAAEADEERRKEITQTYMLFVKAAFFDYAANILKANPDTLLLDVVTAKQHQHLTARGIRSAMRSEARTTLSGFFQKASGSVQGRLVVAGAVIFGVAFLQTVLSLAAFKALMLYVGAAMVTGAFASAVRGIVKDVKRKADFRTAQQAAELERQHQLRNQIWGALDAWPDSAKQNWIEAEESARIPDPDSITDDYARGSLHLKLAGIAFRKHLALGMGAKDISEIISHNLKLALQDFRKVDYDRAAGILLNALEKLELESTSSSKALELFVEYFILARLRAQPRKAWADAPLPQGGYVLGNNPTQAELKNYPLPISKDVVVFLLPGESKFAFKPKPLYRDLLKNKNRIRFVELKSQDYVSREALTAKLRSVNKKKPFDVLITPFAGLMPEKQNQYPAELQRYFEDAKDLYELETGRVTDQVFYETDLVPTLANYFVAADEKTVRISSQSLFEGHKTQEFRTPYSIITALMAFVAGTLGWKRGILQDDGRPILADAFYRTGIYGDERPQQPNEPSKLRRIFLVSPHPDDDVIAAKAILAQAMKFAQKGEVVAEVIVMQPGENGVVDLNETQMKEALRLALGYAAGDLNAVRVTELKKAWGKTLTEIRVLHESVLAEYKERYPAAAEKFKAKLETFKGVDFEDLFNRAASLAWSDEELKQASIEKQALSEAQKKLLKETAKYFIRRIENQRAIDFFNDAYPGKIRAQFFPEFLGYPSSGPQDLRFIHELEEHAAVVMQHLLMKFERLMKDAPKDAVLTVVGPSGIDAHAHHVEAYRVLLEAMRLWASQASRQSERDVEVLYYFAPWSGNLPAYHLSPQTKKSTNADLLRALIAGELTASRFGLSSPKELQTMQAQRYLVRPSILVNRSEARNFRQEKSAKFFIAAAEALKKGDRRRFESEKQKLEKLGMLVLTVGNPEFFPKNWKAKRPRVYTRAEREEVLRLVTAKVKHTMTPQEKRQLRVTVESQILAIGEDEVGLIGVQNYDEGESSKFNDPHLQVVSASDSSHLESMTRQLAGGFMNMTQYGGAENIAYQAQYLWWVGTEAFSATSEQLHGGSYSEVHRFFNPDGSSHVVKTADPRKDGGKLLDEARMIQSLPEDAAVYFPKILKIIETPEKTEVWMEDLQGASLTGLINSAPGMVHMSRKEDLLSFSPFVVARQIYSLLLSIFYMRKKSDTPDDFAEKYHFSKLEKRWQEAEAVSPAFKKWINAPYVKVYDHRGQVHLLPNFKMMLRIFRALAKAYPDYFKPPYLSYEHGDLHFGNIMADIFDVISDKALLRFKLIDPKWMPEGNDPLYDFAKLLHNLFGHYDLALDHSDTYHFNMQDPGTSADPLEMSDYVDDEAVGTLEMLERTRQFQIETWEFLRTHRGAAFPFEKDPVAWRIRLLFTEASLIAGLFPFHIKSLDKTSILYERALTLFSHTLEFFVSLQDGSLIPTKDKKLRKALRKLILAQQTKDEAAFVKALKEVDAVVSARSEMRDWNQIMNIYRDREELMNDPELKIDFENKKKILSALFDRRTWVWDKIKTERGEFNADLFYQELLKWYQENEAVLLSRLIESQSLLTLRNLNKAFAAFDDTKQLSAIIRDRVLNLSRDHEREAAELAKRTEQLKDLPALHRNWVKGRGNGERSFARMIREKALEVPFKYAVTQAYRKHYGLMEGVMREFGFKDYTKFRNLLRELEIETASIKLEDGDLLAATGKTKTQILTIARQKKWNILAIQKRLFVFSQMPYTSLQLIRGLGIVEEFKAEAQARVRAAGGIKTVDVPASFGIDKAIFKQLEDELNLDLAKPASQAEGFLTQAFGSKNQVLADLVALNWNLPKWIEALEAKYSALSKMNGHIYFLRGYGLTDEFKTEYRKKFNQEKGNLARVAKHFGVNPPTFRKILSEIDPPKAIQTTEDALKFLREHDWNIPALVKRIQTQGVGKGKKIDREFKVVLAPFNLRESLKAEVEARWRASYGFYGGILKSFGFKNVAGSAFPEVLDLYKIKLDEKILQPGDLLGAFGMTKEALLEKLNKPVAEDGWDWNLPDLFKRVFAVTDGRWHQADILRALNIEEEFRAEYAATREKYYWSLDRVADRFGVKGGKNFAPLAGRLNLPTQALTTGDLSLAFGWTPEEAIAKLDAVDWNFSRFVRENKDRLPHQQTGLANIFHGLGIATQIEGYLEKLEERMPVQNDRLRQLGIEPPTYKKLRAGLKSRSEMRTAEESVSFLDWVKTSDFIFRLGSLNQVELLLRDGVNPGEISLASLLNASGEGLAFGFDIPPIFHDEGVTIINSGLYRALQDRGKGRDFYEVRYLDGANQEIGRAFNHDHRRKYGPGMGAVKGGSKHSHKSQNRSEMREVEIKGEALRLTREIFLDRQFEVANGGLKPKGRDGFDDDLKKWMLFFLNSESPQDAEIKLRVLKGAVRAYIAYARSQGANMSGYQGPSEEGILDYFRANEEVIGKIPKLFFYRLAGTLEGLLLKEMSLSSSKPIQISGEPDATQKDPRELVRAIEEAHRGLVLGWQSLQRDFMQIGFFFDSRTGLTPSDRFFSPGIFFTYLGLGFTPTLHGRILAYEFARRRILGASVVAPSDANRNLPLLQVTYERADTNGIRKAMAYVLKKPLPAPEQFPADYRGFLDLIEQDPLKIKPYVISGDESLPEMDRAHKLLMQAAEEGRLLIFGPYFLRNAQVEIYFKKLFGEKITDPKIVEMMTANKQSKVSPAEEFGLPDSSQIEAVIQRSVKSFSPRTKLYELFNIAGAMNNAKDNRRVMDLFDILEEYPTMSVAFPYLLDVFFSLEAPGKWRIDEAAARAVIQKMTAAFNRNQSEFKAFVEKLDSQYQEISEENRGWRVLQAGEFALWQLRLADAKSGLPSLKEWQDALMATLKDEDQSLEQIREQYWKTVNLAARFSEFTSDKKTQAWKALLEPGILPPDFFRAKTGLTNQQIRQNYEWLLMYEDLLLGMVLNWADDNAAVMQETWSRLNGLISDADLLEEANARITAYKDPRKSGKPMPKTEADALRKNIRSIVVREKADLEKKLEALFEWMNFYSVAAEYRSVLKEKAAMLGEETWDENWMRFYPVPSEVQQPAQTVESVPHALSDWPQMKQKASAAKEEVVPAEPAAAAPASASAAEPKKTVTVVQPVKYPEEWIVNNGFGSTQPQIFKDFANQIADFGLVVDGALDNEVKKKGQIENNRSKKNITDLAAEVLLQLIDLRRFELVSATDLKTAEEARAKLEAVIKTLGKKSKAAADYLAPKLAEAFDKKTATLRAKREEQTAQAKSEIEAALADFNMKPIETFADAEAISSMQSSLSDQINQASGLSEAVKAPYRTRLSAISDAKKYAFKILQDLIQVEALDLNTVLVSVQIDPKIVSIADRLERLRLMAEVFKSDYEGLLERFEVFREKVVKFKEAKANDKKLDEQVRVVEQRLKAFASSQFAADQAVAEWRMETQKLIDHLPLAARTQTEQERLNQGADSLKDQAFQYLREAAAREAAKKIEPAVPQAAPVKTVSAPVQTAPMPAADQTQRFSRLVNEVAPLFAEIESELISENKINDELYLKLEEKMSALDSIPLGSLKARDRGDRVRAEAIWRWLQVLQAWSDNSEEDFVLRYADMAELLDRAEFKKFEATVLEMQAWAQGAAVGFDKLKRDSGKQNLHFIPFREAVAARSEMRGVQPSAVQVVAAHLFAAGFVSPEAAVYYLNHREEFLEILPQLVSTELQQQEMEKLQSILGTDITVKDGVILSSGLVEQGFLAAAGKIFKDVPFAFIAEGEQKAEALKLIKEEGWADRIFIADNIQHAQALLKKHGVTRIQGMALADEEASLGIKDVISFTRGQLQKFYEAAGILGEVQHWAQIFSAFATAA